MMSMQSEHLSIGSAGFSGPEAAAYRLRMTDRCLAVMFAHFGNTACAAAMAVIVSSAFILGMVASTLPVAGFVTYRSYMPTGDSSHALEGQGLRALGHPPHCYKVLAGMCTEQVCLCCYPDDEARNRRCLLLGAHQECIRNTAADMDDKRLCSW